MTVSFKEFRETNPLFLDFLYQFEKVSSHFRYDPKSGSDWSDAVAAAGRRAVDREKLVAVLTEQNARWGAGNEALANIARLKESKTLAVVTGQQMGLFLGPLYTVYKALGTIRLCAHLKKKFPDHDFVPVFWMELEDHDFDEVRKTSFVNTAHQLTRLEYSDDAVSGRRQPVHSILLGPQIAQIHAGLAEQTPETEFKNAILNQLSACYAERTSFSDAFAKLMHVWVGRGLILFDPSHPVMKQQAEPVFRKEIECAAEVNESLSGKIRQLRDQGYPIQVETGPANLFLMSDGERRAITMEGAAFRVKGNQKTWSGPDLLALCEKTPERFVPNVVLRPIVQDSLLPTVAYLGGPSEIAYFAEYLELYRFFGIEPPVILPRPFMTLVEKKIDKIVKKHGVVESDLINRGAELVNEVVMASSESDVKAVFGRAETAMSDALERLEADVKSIDPTLGNAAETSAKKMQYQLNSLKQKAVEAEKRKQDVLVRQLNQALTHLSPGGNFQERELGLPAYLVKYGPGLIDRILEAADPLAMGHQFISL